MRFTSPEALGIWARDFGVARVVFDEASDIREVEFAQSLALPELVSDSFGEETAPTAVQKALAMLNGKRPPKADADE